jgi:hypothetical protein
MIGATAALWIVTQTLLPTSAAEFPLDARIAEGSPPRVELINVGDQPVTAWSFAVASPNEQGGVHREIHTADVYLSEVTRGLPRSEAHLDWLRPGQSRALPIDAAPHGARVEVVAVILADGTGLGDAPTLEALFAHRAAERDQLRDVVETFNAVLGHERGVAALQALKARFASGGSPGSVPRRSAREAVDAYLTKANAGSEEEADRSIRMYAAFVTRQYELAVQHAQRKQRL